jgi:aryl-alcohol dehydrogenase-like predicted oxidoreductase
MKVSKICLGAAQLGMNYGINNLSGRPGPGECQAIVRTAVTNGITTFDTAPAYGESERVLGECLAEIGGEFTVISKLPNINWKLSQEDIAAQIHRSVSTTLVNLQVTKLPICLFHRFEDMYLKERFALKEVAFLKDTGMVEKIGASVYTPEEADACLRTPACEVIQVPFSLVDKRLLEVNFFKQAKERRKIVFARSVFLQGLIFKVDLPLPLIDLEVLRGDLSALAVSERMNLRELALRYVLSFDEIDSVIIGVERTEQLMSNIEIMRKGKLPPALIDAVNELGSAPEHVVDPRQWPAAR